MRDTIALIPGARHVIIKGAAHPSLFWGDCAPGLVSRFINTLKLGDTGCASRSPFDYPGVTKFPREAASSPGMAPAPGNRAGGKHLRIARVALDTALDALKRSFASSGDGPGLRGGTFHTDFDDVWTITLMDSRWTEDVAVSGTLRWSSSDGAFEAQVEVDGPGRHDGTLRLTGGWQVPNAPKRITVSGTLDGERVRATMASF